MNIKLLIEHHSEFLSLKGGCTVSSASTLVKMPHCWKSHVTAHLQIFQVNSHSGELKKVSNELIKVHTGELRTSISGYLMILCERIQKLSMITKINVPHSHTADQPTAP